MCVFMEYQSTNKAVHKFQKQSQFSSSSIILLMEFML